MNWIINQKKYQIIGFMGSVFVITMIDVMLMISSVLMLCAFRAKGADWYAIALQQQAENEIFFVEKANEIFFVLNLAVVFVFVYVVASLGIFRTMQLKKKKRCIWTYFMLGYEEKTVRKLLVLDHMIDVTISLIPAIIIFYYTIDLMMQKDEFSMIMSVINLNWKIGLIQIVLCFLCVHEIMVFYENYWMRKGRGFYDK